VLADRGAAVLRRLDTRPADALKEALARRETDSLALGRGTGLTPSGDDALAGALAVAAALGRAPRSPTGLTTALSRTLLDLAVAGYAPPALDDVLGAGESDWRAALDRLLAVGASTGRAYACGAATACVTFGRR
jgi:hypothetical protein